MRKEDFQAALTKMGWAPHPGQMRVLRSRARRKLLVGGVQAGKTTTAAGYTCLQIYKSIYDGTAVPGDVYWLVGDDYSQTKFEYARIAQYLALQGLRGKMSSRHNPGIIQLNSCPCQSPLCPHERMSVQTKSAVDITKLAGESPAGIVVCEGAQVSWDVIEKCEERLLKSDGWLLIAGTLEGSLGWYPERQAAWGQPATQMEENAESFSMPSWENLAAFPGGRNDPKILEYERLMSPERFNERVAAIASPPEGRVFKRFRYDIHVRDIPFDSGLPVYVWADPGYYPSAHAVLFAQFKDGKVNVFDSIHEWYYTTSQVIEILKHREWFSAVTDWRGALDGFGGIQHHTTSEDTTTDQERWLHGLGVYMEPMRTTPTDGIEIINQVLEPDPVTKQPGIFFANGKWIERNGVRERRGCWGIISEMGAGLSPLDNQDHTWKWLKNRHGDVMGKKPEERNNHAISALYFGLTALLNPTGDLAGLSRPREAVMTRW